MFASSFLYIVLCYAYYEEYERRIYIGLIPLYIDLDVYMCWYEHNHKQSIIIANRSRLRIKGRAQKR